MSERRQPRSAERKPLKERAVGRRRAYRPPRLVCYGSISELTRMEGNLGSDGTFLGSTDET